MSYPQGEHAPQNSLSRGPARGQQRPSLDRPSLFAGMEDDTAPDDIQRVRILSTLESTRRTSRPTRTKGGRRTRKTQPSSWLQGALWGALGVGVLALMAGFVMVIQDTQPALAHPAPAKPLMAAPAEITLAPTSAGMPGATTGPAVIETMASIPPAMAAASAVPPAPPAPGLLSDLAPASTPTVPTMAAKSASSSPANHSAAMPAGKTGTGNGKVGKTPKGQDEDVALLEAMFQHTGRKTGSAPHNAAHK